MGELPPAQYAIVSALLSPALQRILKHAEDHPAKHNCMTRALHNYLRACALPNGNHSVNYFLLQGKPLIAAALKELSDAPENAKKLLEYIQETLGKDSHAIILSGLRKRILELMLSQRDGTQIARLGQGGLASAHGVLEGAFRLHEMLRAVVFQHNAFAEEIFYSQAPVIIARIQDSLGEYDPFLSSTLERIASLVPSHYAGVHIGVLTVPQPSR